jgi:hypothetical protein
MSNNRESEYTQPEDFLDLSPYDDLDCEMELDRESIFEIYEPEKENESQETDKEKSETGEQECMDYSVQEKVEFNSDDGFDPADCSMGSPKRVEKSLQEFSDDEDRMKETEMRKLMTARLKLTRRPEI